ncbi:MAG: hypothetical protein AAFY81_07095 [Pseudomonadota bacterium]
MTPNGIEKDAECYLLSDDDWFELQTIMSALHGMGELVLVSGEPGLLPEVRTENMASILLNYAQHGQAILRRGQLVEQS